MRTPAANKAVATAGRCPKCGRERTPFGCREVEIGSYCVQFGLWAYAQGYLVPPTPDPIGQREAGVIELNAPLIADAEKAVDDALARYDAADRRQFEAVVALGQAGVQPAPGAPHLAPAYGSFEQRVQQRRRVTPKEAAALREAEESAREEKADAEASLARARVRLSSLEQRYEGQRRRARLTDREVA